MVHRWTKGVGEGTQQKGGVSRLKAIRGGDGLEMKDLVGKRVRERGKGLEL